MRKAMGSMKSQMRMMKSRSPRERKSFYYIDQKSGIKNLFGLLNKGGWRGIKNYVVTFASFPFLKRMVNWEKDSLRPTICFRSQN